MARAAPPLSTPEPLGFPNCQLCPLREAGSASVCYECAAKTLPQHKGPRCGVCAQAMEGDRCGNRMCRSDRGFGIAHVVAVHKDNLRTANLRYKNDGRKGWAAIFGRILVGYLEEHLDPATVDLIVPNPSADPFRQHNERVIDAARHEDFYGWWNFDEQPWAITKRHETERSAARSLSEKTRLARLHAEAIDVDDAFVRGKRVLVYDDVFTTGSQLDQVGRLLLAHGAKSVDGLVLARAPWT